MWLICGCRAVGSLLSYCRPDIYAVAFQEIVELTAQQIIQVDPAKRSVQRAWERLCYRGSVFGPGSVQRMGADDL